MKIDPDILAVLELAEPTPRGIVLIGQLDRKLYERVNKVLMATGWKWQGGKIKAHTHPNADPAEALESLLNTGEVATPSEFGFFETTGYALDRLMQIADVRPGQFALAPNAGSGNIVRRLIAAGAKVHAYEIQAHLHDALWAMNARAWALSDRPQDFLMVEPHRYYDAVVMNPPFAKQADIQHVAHAIRFLKPGGRLTAIMASGVRFRTNGRTRMFHEAIAGMSPVWEDLPEGSFKASGTNVNTCILSLVAP